MLKPVTIFQKLTWKMLLLGGCVVGLGCAGFVGLNTAQVASLGTARAATLQVDPYAAPELAAYRRYREALAANNYVTLRELAQGDDYVAYRAAARLARDESLGAQERLEQLERLLTLRIDDPLDRVGKRELLSELGATAEEAGNIERAIAAYTDALPASEAIAGLRRLQDNPYQLSNTFLNARQNRLALDALARVSAPSIEATAYERLRENEQALDAYERWLTEVPNSFEARYGKAKTLFRLGQFDEADAIFEQLGTRGANYWRGLIANRRGETSQAVAFLLQSGDPEDFWLAAELLENAGRSAEALELYLNLAQQRSSYTDDAAYRAIVLAERLGNADQADQARSLLPPESFFSRKLGNPLSMNIAEELPVANPSVLALSNALIAANDPEAARGELVFALRAATDVGEKVAIGKALQTLGEYRQPQRVGAALLEAGETDAQVWRLAYPQAYSEYVAPEAERFGVEKELVWAIMRQESAFYERAVSRSNARGLMQVIPSTWEWLAELQNEAPSDPFNANENIRYGVFYLRWLSDFFSDYQADLELIISSYNRGQGYISRLYESSAVAQNKDELYRNIDSLETREYLQEVMTNYEIYKALY